MIIFKEGIKKVELKDLEDLKDLESGIYEIQRSGNCIMTIEVKK